MKNILIGGYYGAGNLGDEAILECMLSEMRSINQDINFTIISWAPDLVTQKFNVNSIHWKDLPGFFDSAQKSDLIILGGGGLFQDYWGINPETYLRTSAWDITAYGGLPLLAKLMDIPAMIYSVGLGPLSSPLAREHTRIAFENCQIATLRDKESFELLLKCGFALNKKNNVVQVLPDPVFSLRTSNEDDIDVEEYFIKHHLDLSSEYIGIVLRYWDFSGPYKDWLKTISSAINMFLAENRNYKVILLPFQINPDNHYTDDDVILSELASSLNDPQRVFQVKENHSPRFVQALIKRFKVLLGMRLHSLIMGINVNTPVIGLPYDPKITSIMKEASLDDYCCSSLNIDSDELNDLIKKGIDESLSIQKRMESFRKIALKDSQKNAILALSLLEKSEKYPHTFQQDFSINQAKIILELDKQIEQVKNENTNLNRLLDEKTQVQAEHLDQISKIKNTVDIQKMQLDEQLDTIKSLNSSLELQTSRLNDQLEIANLLHSTIEMQTSRLNDQLEINKYLHSTIESQTSKLNDQLEIKKALDSTIQLQTSRLNDQTEAIRKLLDDLEIEQEKQTVIANQCSAYQVQLEAEATKNKNLTAEMTGTKDQLNSIYNSKLWKIFSNYYKAVEKPPLNSLYRLVSHKKRYQKKDIYAESKANSNLDGQAILTDVIGQLNSRKNRGIFIITSAFEYDRKRNQRVIHLSQFLSKLNFGVIFIAWRWSKDEVIRNIGKEVDKNIFQIPVDMFVENTNCFERLKAENKYFVIELPHPDFYTTGLKLKSLGYKIIYDIIDEWEEFHKVGQAIWYKKDYEEALVLNSDYLFAVSKPLKEKFGDIRSDIEIVPNGFDPNLIGIRHQNIAQKKPKTDTVHIGYFGHLTPSWFDWDFLFSTVELALQQGRKIKFELIGTVEPNEKKRLEVCQDNIVIHGQVNPEDLFNYVKNWDLAMIPFKPGKLAEAVDPLKVYEYSFFGLSTIVTGITHLKELEHVEVVKTPTEFITIVDTLMANNTTGLDTKKRFLRGFFSPKSKELSKIIKHSTWEDRFANIVEALNTKKWIF